VTARIVSWDLTIAAIGGLAGAAMWIAICDISAQPGSGCGTLFVVLLAMYVAIEFGNLSGTVALVSVHIVVAGVWNACCRRWTARPATPGDEVESRDNSPRASAQAEIRDTQVDLKREQR
jgi:hypothetical protein